jgi:hypothetical protein
LSVFSFNPLVGSGHHDDPDSSITRQRTALAEQMAAIEPRNLRKAVIQAKPLADLLVVGDALEPEQSLAVSLAERLDVLPTGLAARIKP